MVLQIEQIPVLNDNYVYLVRDPEREECAVVDPAVAGPVLDRLEKLGWKLSYIFNTHHHGDHTGANLELKQKTGCKIIGAAGDAARIPGIDHGVKAGDHVALGANSAEVFEVPGHTSGHIAYWFAQDKVLFCGDTLFALGCGRLFEGTAAQMWQSLLKLRTLPGETRVYCAHEYTQSNAKFAQTIEPLNEQLTRRVAHINVARSRNEATVPSLLAEEIATNPFLRADQPDLQRAIDMIGCDAVEVFAEVRRRKDVF